jgi:two-component sensor histidine kinase
VATVLSALLAVYFFVEPRHSLSLPLVQVPTVVLFVAICAAIATVGEALRKALERAIEAERTNALLLSELNHRTKNNLAVIITLLRLQSRRIEAEAARVPFEQSIERIRVMASMHDHLVQTGGSVQMQAYLSDLSRHLGDTQRGLRPIEVRVDADDVKVRADLASALGLIANELITNAFKYGFPDDRAGSVDLILRNEGGQLRMTVTDDGVGLDPRRPDGLGTKLVKLLAQQHGGTAERRRGVTGTVNEICVPLSE